MSILQIIIEICFTGQYAVYSWIIIGIFLVSLLLLLTGSLKIFNGIREGYDHLSGFTQEGEASKKENYIKINNFLGNSKDLSHAWNEFNECIVAEIEVETINGEENERTVYKNSRPAEEFFQFDEIVYNSSNWFLGVKFGVFDAIPNILTGLGILGTFYGIISGLPESTAFQSNSENMLVSISYFVAGMKVAFGTSLLGLSLSLLFNVIEKTAHDTLEQKINRLAFHIDYLFVRKTEQDYLYSIKKQMEDLNDSINDMPVKMSNSIAEGFANMGVQREEIGSRIKEGVKAGFEKLGTMIEESLDRQNEINQVTKNIINELELTAKGVKETTDLVKLSNQGTSNITDNLNVLDKSLDQLSSNLVPEISKAVEANSIIQESIVQLNSSMKLGVETSQAFRSDFEAITDKIQGVSTEFVAAYSDFQDLVTQSIKSNLEGFDVQLGSSVSRLASAADGFGNVIGQIEEIHEEIRKKLQEPNP